MNVIGSAFRIRLGGLKVLLFMGGVLALGLMQINSAWGVTLGNEDQKLLALDGEANDFFSRSVSVSGNVALVGAQDDDDKGINSGSAYIFRWNSSNWVEEQKLLASDGAAYESFGSSVSVSGEVALVGAQYDDDQGHNSGSAYIFRWNGSNWVEEQKLLASDGDAEGYFGVSVSISGDVAIVGAAYDDDQSANSGSAYIFRWNGSNWVEEQKLLASDGAAYDQFGESVSVSGDIALVGATQDDDKGGNSGSAYIFRWNGSAWVEEQKLLASDGEDADLFGISVSVSGDVALVGAWSKAAYIFRWNGSAWGEEQKLLASDGAAYDYFGGSVSVSGDVALVGAGGDDDNGQYSGSAYIFRWNGSAWVEEQKLLASDGAAYDYFGGSVSVSGDVALVGASGDDDNGQYSGSAYVFSLALDIEVGIDIKPGSYSNCININGNGVIPVAILGSDYFNVTKIDVGTLSFAGLDVRIKGNGSPQCSVEDVSGDFTLYPEGGPDGYDDLVCQYIDNSEYWVPDEGTASVTGKLLDGTPIKGIDSICIVP